MHISVYSKIRTRAETHGSRDRMSAMQTISVDRVNAMRIEVQNGGTKSADAMRQPEHPFTDTIRRRAA